MRSIGSTRMKDLRSKDLSRHPHQSSAVERLLSFFMWRNWQHRHRSAPCGRCSEVRMAQRSKSCEVNNEQKILGTASGYRGKIQVLVNASSCGFKVSAAASVGASVLCTEVSTGHPRLGCRLGRCFCATHRGVHRTPAPRHPHQKTVLRNRLLVLFTFGELYFFAVILCFASLLANKIPPKHTLTNTLRQPIFPARNEDSFILKHTAQNGYVFGCFA